MPIKMVSGHIGQMMAQAAQSNDENIIAEAWDAFHSALRDEILEDFDELKRTNDATILSNRGYRQLTSEETKFYQKLAGALKSENPKQAFAEIIGDDIESDLMPETIYEDIYRNLTEDHSILSKINFQYVKYATKWILNDHTKQKAVWGKITAEITEEITSGFKVVDIKQNKLSAYAVIEKGMLDLGPVFLDAYIRAVLAEALRVGLESAIISGNGVDSPIGINRDIHEGVSFSTSTGYPEKTAEKVTDFTPATYGSLVAKVAKTESGHLRKFSEVQLICNMIDYLTKVMPATTVLNDAGRYVNDLFPFPTEVLISNEVDTGDAYLGHLGEYSLLVGGDRKEQIEISDEFKFLDDERYFKVKQYATGRAFDNTSFIKLDISSLDPAYMTVKAITTVTGDINMTDVTPASTEGQDVPEA